MKNPYRVETEDGHPTLIFFVKKATKADLTRAAKETNLNVSEMALDSQRTCFKVYPKLEGQELGPKPKKTKPADERIVTTKDEWGHTKVVGGHGPLTRPLSPDAMLPPTLSRLRRINVTLDVSMFKDVEARAKALGLLPGQYARMVLVQSLNTKEVNGE
jgi:hypothetical protein